jgi:hypothetical protein
MTTWHELEEYHRVNRDISTSCSTNARPQSTKSDKIVCAGYGTCKYPSDEYSSVEGWFASYEVGRYTPERCTKYEADIVRNRTV